MSTRENVVKSRTARGYARNEPLTRVNAKVSGKKVLTTCGYCGGQFLARKSKAGRILGEFCLPRCRLLFWALGEVLRDLKADKAGGVKDIIRELSEKAV